MYFPLSIQMNILTLYNNCCVILSKHMLDSALEPSYNLSKNLFLMPWKLKLIVDMVNDSTPLILYYAHIYFNYSYTNDNFYPKNTYLTYLPPGSATMGKEAFG